MGGVRVSGGGVEGDVEGKKRGWCGGGRGGDGGTGWKRMTWWGGAGREWGQG